MARIVSGKVARRPGDAAVGGGGGSAANSNTWVFISSVTATGASQFSSGSFASVATAYVGLKVFLTGLRQSGGAAGNVIGMRTSSDGVNYAASDTAYSFAGGGNGATGAAPLVDTTSTATSYFSLTATAGVLQLGFNVSENMCAEITLQFATATNRFPLFTADVISEGNEVWGQFLSGRRTESVGVAGVLIANLDGINFSDGRMDIYGIRAA